MKSGKNKLAYYYGTIITAAVRLLALAFPQSDQVLPQPSAVQIVACVLMGEKVVIRSDQVEQVRLHALCRALEPCHTGMSADLPFRQHDNTSAND